MISPAAHPNAAPWAAHPVEILAKQPETVGVKTYHLRLIDPVARAGFRCQPGQFNMLYLPGVGEAAISVSGYDPTTDAWLHTVRTAGGVTQTLARLDVGGRFLLRGPFGSAWPLAEVSGGDLLFAAGGIGLAPLRPAIEWALARREQFGELSLVYGARSPSTILYHEQLDAWRRQGLAVQVTVDRSDVGWLGNIGVVTLLVDRLRLRNPSNTSLFVCGPDVMMRYVVRSALQRELAPSRVWLTLERNMQCAVGLCGHCQFGPAFICKDGPVLRYDQLAPYLGLEDL